MMIARPSTVSGYLILGFILLQCTFSCTETVDVIDSNETPLTEKNDGIESENFLPVANHLNAQPHPASQERENISDEDEEGSGSDDDDNLIEPSVLALSPNIPDESEGSGDEPVSKEDEINDSSESTNATIPLIISDSAERDGASYETTETTNAETASNDTIQLAIDNTSNNPTNVANENVAQVNHLLPIGQSANQPAITTIIDSTARPDTELIKPIDTNSTHSDVARINHPVKESQATYILLACLGVILVLLIFYLVYKRYRSTSKHTHYINDAENAPQEMLNMNRNNIGKPLRSSNDDQCIHIPLIPDNEKGNAKTNGLTSIEEPLLQHSLDISFKNGHCELEHVANGVHDGQNDNNIITTTAATPHKSPRYSPVSPAQPTE